MTQVTTTFEQEVGAGRRFRFGENWSQFLELLSESRIAQAEQSLIDRLGRENLCGKAFLDIGSGSGLFSLAARKLGARPYSVDFDPDSVACTRCLRERFFPNDSSWQVEQGSVLDERFMSRLPKFHVVYAWGVLHHTGNMLRAIELALDRVEASGLAYLALYRKTWLCPFWKVEKRAYCSSPAALQGLMRGVYRGTLGIAHRLKNPGHKAPRGMDLDRDLHDWLGGYPYESVTPRVLKRLVTQRGFVLQTQVIKTEGVHFTPGCDEYVFRNPSEAATPGA